MPGPSRRSFLSTTGLAAASAAPGIAAACSGVAPDLGASSFHGGTGSGRRTPRKAIKFGMLHAPDDVGLVERFQRIARLGFDGVELDSPNGYETEAVLEARDAAGLPIHGVVDSVHWKQTLGDPDPRVRVRGLEGLLKALRDAKSYGASTVLLVPGVVRKDITYQQVWTRSTRAIRTVLPLCGELGIRIAIENVWNGVLTSPLDAARYIDQFESPWIGFYLDPGNLVKFAWPEHFVEVLGERILKVDVKDFDKKTNSFGVKLLEGDTDWPSVVRALEAVGYRGWYTAEMRGGDAAYLADVAARMDRILKP